MASEMVRIPNSDVWINTEYVVAVARMPDSVLTPAPEKPGHTAPRVTMINFQIRSADGKSTNVQVSDRNEMRLFLSSIGIIWEG